MEPRLQRRVQRYGWDKAAVAYETYWHRQLAPAQKRLLELAGLQSGETVLDVACGTGLVSFPAAEAVGPQGKLLGTDISGEMVAVASERAASAGLSQAAFLRADGESLDLPEETFDVALCALGLMYMPEPVTALKEMHRVLKPGGRALALVWGARANCGWAELFPIVDARVPTDVCPLFFQLGTGDTLRDSFAAAGFADVHSERLNLTLPFATDEAACRAAFDGGAVALAYHHFDESLKNTVKSEYIASLARYKNGSGYKVPGEFVVVSASKER